jgi:hypothetical protein
MSDQAAFGFAEEPREPDPRRKANLERAVEAIVAGFDLRVADYAHEIVVHDRKGFARCVSVAFRAVLYVTAAARYMGKSEQVAAAFERWADAMDEHHRARFAKTAGEFTTPDWRPAELTPEDFYAA